MQCPRRFFAASSVRTAVCQKIMIAFVELAVSSLVECVAYLLHKLVIEIEIMQNRKPHAERLLCLEEVADIRPRIIPAGGTSTAF